MKYAIPAFFAMTILAVSCQQGAQQQSAGTDSAAQNAIDTSTYLEYVKTLSSDDFKGRLPGSPGEEKTIQYIKSSFEALGLQAGNGEDYFQQVSLVEVTSSPNQELVIQGRTGAESFNLLDDYVLVSRKQEDIHIDKTDLVFVGFGIVAPEYNWNDYEGLNVKGKTVVVMVNDPGFYNPDLFKGKTMTYYGRWTYKYEEAARQGAAGVLIIHDTAPASYGWDVVRSGWSGPQMTLKADANSPGTATIPPFEGWITGETASKLFKLAGQSDELLATAKKSGFRAVDLALSTSIAIKNTVKHTVTHNVLAKIEGSKRPDEVIIYGAHWDHLGIGEAVAGDSIYNGAMDNATGVAGLFELAKAFKAAQVPPERTILFIALTAEEQGLLGSEYYVAHPVYALSKTVANINIDALSPTGKTRDMTVVGFGQSDLDDYAQAAAKAQNRQISPDPNPSSGGFFRSDHFNFVKAGIPALYAGSGQHYIDTSATAQADRDTFKGTYHSPADEVTDRWNVHGIVEDLRVLFTIGYQLSMETTFPQWKDGSEFKNIQR